MARCSYCYGTEQGCGVKNEAGLVCTRAPGHDGEHVACGAMHVLARWGGPGEPSPAYLRTLRDRAAVAAMQGILASDSDPMTPWLKPEDVAERATVAASALVAALYPGEVRDE